MFDDEDFANAWSVLIRDGFPILNQFLNILAGKREELEPMTSLMLFHILGTYQFHAYEALQNEEDAPTAHRLAVSEMVRHPQVNAMLMATIDSQMTSIITNKLQGDETE